jgi:hypothetical protein
MKITVANTITLNDINELILEQGCVQRENNININSSPFTNRKRPNTSEVPSDPLDETRHQHDTLILTNFLDKK